MENSRVRRYSGDTESALCKDSSAKALTKYMQANKPLIQSHKFCYCYFSITRILEE